MCGGKKSSPAPAPVAAPVADPANANRSQAAADTAAQRVTASTVLSDTDNQSAFGAELATGGQ